MSLIASEQGKQFPIAPAGVHTARCFRIVDLGTQKGEYQGKPKVNRIVSFSWELPDALMEDGRPFSINKDFTLGLSEKSALRLALEAWRGRKFTAAELEGFDITKVLGAPCMLNVVHAPGRSNGKIYANIAGIMPLPGSMIAPAAINPKLLFSLNEFNQGIYDSLSDYLKGKIQLSPEYQAIMGGAPRGISQGAESSYNDDDIPF